MGSTRARAGHSFTLPIYPVAAGTLYKHIGLTTAITRFFFTTRFTDRRAFPNAFASAGINGEDHTTVWAMGWFAACPGGRPMFGGVDIDKAKVDCVNGGLSPIREPGCPSPTRAAVEAGNRAV